MSVVVWDPNRDSGNQIIGKVEEGVDSAFANGYLKEDEQRSIESVPEAERDVILLVEKVLNFREAPHNDHEL